MKNPDSPSPEHRRHDRLVQDTRHDPYRDRTRPAEPTVCSECGAVFRGGRWHGGSEPEPAGAHHALCEACRRVRDHVPAGILTLEGGFLGGHAEEIRHLVEHVAAAESGEHPMHRIMGREETEGRWVIETTDVHLPRRLGEAVRRAYEGDLETQYGPDETSVRITWRRDA